MDYKKEIIELINKIESGSILEFLYSVISTYLRNKGIGEEVTGR